MHTIAVPIMDSPRPVASIAFLFRQNPQAHHRTDCQIPLPWYLTQSAATAPSLCPPQPSFHLHSIPQKADIMQMITSAASALHTGTIYCHTPRYPQCFHRKHYRRKPNQFSTVPFANQPGKQQHRRKFAHCRYCQQCSHPFYISPRGLPQY